MMKIGRYIYSIYAILLFTVLMIVVFPFILLFSAVDKKKKGHVVYHIIKIWAIVWYACIFIRHKTMREAPYDKEKQYIYVANHISYLDIPQLILSVKRPVKVLGRHDLAKIPVFGIIYKTMVVSVNRDAIKDRINSFNHLKKVLQNGCSVFLFPEGTFNMTERPLKAFHDGAFKLSTDTNIPVKPIVFLDTNKRLNNKSILGFSPGVCRSVILEEIQPNSPQTLTASDLKQCVFEKMMNTLLANQ